jgi:mannose-6-phosphate isomerase-like protein (cupin superfamily)
MGCKLTLSTVLILLIAACTGAPSRTPSEQMTESDKQFLLTYPNLEDPDGEVVLENEHLVIQRLIVGPGEWEGIHSHPGNQIYVHVKGGEWSGRIGGKSEYAGDIDEDGAVGWMDAIPLSVEHDSGNTGNTPIDIIYVTLKGEGPITPEVKHLPQSYPDLSLELVLENDLLIVQRLHIEPGQWTGIHNRPGNQVYIHIKGGTWSQRRNGVQSLATPISKDGSVGWIDAAGLDKGHEYGNTGDTSIHLVLVTLK